MLATTAERQLIHCALKVSAEGFREALARNPNLTFQEFSELCTDSTEGIFLALAQAANSDEKIIKLLKGAARKKKQLTFDIRSTLFSSGLPGASPALTAALLQTRSSLPQANNQSTFLAPVLSQVMTPREASLWLLGTNPPKGQLLKSLLPLAEATGATLLDHHKLQDPTLYSDASLKIVLATALFPYSQDLSPLLEARPTLLPIFVALANKKAKSAHPQSQRGASVLSLLEAIFETDHHLRQQDVLTLIPSSKAIVGDPRYTTLYRLALNPNTTTQTILAILSTFSAALAKPHARQLQHAKIAQLYAQKISDPALVVTGPWSEATHEGQKKLIQEFTKHHLVAVSNPIPTPTQLSPLANLPLSRFALYTDPATLTANSIPLGKVHYWPMTPGLFASQVYPQLQPLGAAGIQLFLSLSIDWHANVAELIATTKSTLLA